MEGDGDNIPPPEVEGAGAGNQQAQQGQVVLGNDSTCLAPGSGATSRWSDGYKGSW